MEHYIVFKEFKKLETFLLLFLLVFTQLLDILSGYEAGIILTTVPRFSGFPDTHHLYVIPGTPYDLATNASLYETDIYYAKSMPPFSQLQGCKMDISRKILYIYNKKYSVLQAIQNFDLRNGLDGVRDIVQFHLGVSKSYVKIAIDWVSHNIYWTDPMFRWIVMQPGDPEIKDISRIIVKDDLERPYALAVDPIGGHIFWSDISRYPKIERATLTGKDREAIISTGLLFPVSIDIDVTGNDRRIYWVDLDRDTVESANLTGGDRRIIKRISHSRFYDVALFRDSLSITDVRRGKVYFINKLNGDTIANPYSRSAETPYGICLYSDEVQPETQDYCATANCSDICVNEGGRALCLCREGFQLTEESTCIEDLGQYHRGLVFSDGNGIYIADIRSLTTSLTSYGYKSIYVSAVGPIKFMTLDMAGRKVIFSTDNDIYSVAIDMENPSHQHIVSSEDKITGMSLDWHDKNIYWTSGITSGSVKVISQTTNNVFTLMAALNNPRGIKILALETKMIWISGISTNKSIEISDLDGTNRRTVVGGGQLNDPKSFEFDSHTNRLYWIDSGYIKAANLDGTNRDILPVSAQAPSILLLYKDYLVWTEDASTQSSLHTADIQDPGSTILTHSFTNIDVIKSLGVLDEKMQPLQKGPCEADNGYCEHICIPIGRNRVCECEYGFTKDPDGVSCSSEPLDDDFILVTDWTHNRIYQISLINDDVRALDTDNVGTPNAVIYNQYNARVIWANGRDLMIHSVFLNGSDHKIDANNGADGGYADRFAVDSTSGNLYFTSVNQTTDGLVGVSVISPRTHKLDLVWGGLKPRDIVVDPQEGLMFWTDHGSVPAVRRASMDGTSVSIIITENIKWPNGIAMEYKEKLLFITDGYYDTIQKCSYNGTCTLIHSDPGAHLMDIELSGVYLYYTAWNKPYITKINRIYTTDISYIANNANLGRLDSISIYSASAEKQSANDYCLPNEGLGDCSTLCLPVPNSYKCACQNGVKLGVDNKICEDVGSCPSDLLNTYVTETCTYLHGEVCQYTCAKFYRSASNNKRITCHLGEWDYAVPCVFSDAMCPENVDQVSFGRACTYRNGANCTYRCSHYHKPTSPDGVMACDNGVWDNANPCTEKVPHCPEEIDNVRFLRACTFQKDEECGFICQNGLVSVTNNSRMTCINGTWEFPNPCTEITTVNTATVSTTTITNTPTESLAHSSETPTPTTSSSSSHRTEAATPVQVKQGPSVIPIAVGISAGVLAMSLIIVLVLIFIWRRSKKRPQSSGFQEFQSPCYQDLLDEFPTTSTGSAPLQSQRPNTTYDLIKFEDLGAQGSPATNDKRDNEYSSLSGRSAMDISGDYQTLVLEQPDYIHPVTSLNNTENFI